ncbi:hypothetical protein BDQ12DRAFT_646081 [Crucibulum laeve]|uniref:Snurportin-1 n=1 Tax=Crucibulum laeve TaxID=68775 RepID=A0A5C3MAD8_9AGAR|nr:hypothetical protein BDQ12DRAFT_646081 [Crucibulum laeve]
MEILHPPSVFAERKSSYKVPPTTIRDKLVSQEARRSKALEEQKRRRSQKIDSARNLDLFADLNLGASDEDEDEDEGVSNVTPASVVPFVSMMESNIPGNTIAGSIQRPQIPVQVQPPRERGTNKQAKKKKKKRANKPNKWADKCMYAELLEMVGDDPWLDGLPTDLETGWVAVGPVPVGKRCLAVTQQSAGVAGVVPNTTLRSRLLGKTLINRFPSTLPPLTVLDCILDENWRDNGILHVLDVVKWKGQDVGDCETPFRFWWRDTRLAELSQTIPPNINFLTSTTNDDPSSSQPKYHFPYPTRFLPVPYHTDTTLPTLYTQIIPFARTTRSLTVEVPVLNPVSEAEAEHHDTFQEVDMNSVEPSQPFTFRAQAPVSLAPVATDVRSDGLLLYVAEASYEAGTSPLSSWIPIVDYEEPGEVRMDEPGEGPLDLFQRLVKRRLEWKTTGLEGTEATMDVEM